MLATIARNYKTPVVLVNQVGGNDSLVFDGSSLVIDSAGNVVAGANHLKKIWFCSRPIP